MMDKVLWGLFFVSTLIIVVSFFVEINFFTSPLFFVSVGLFLLHAVWNMGWWRGIFFMALACGVGFGFEFVGVNFGTMFGGDYIYAVEGIKFMTIPLSVISAWGIFIYTGYCITNLIFRGNKFWLLALSDGLIVVAIDLVLDPLQVAAGSWKWLDGGPYFGIPVGNFVEKLNSTHLIPLLTYGLAFVKMSSMATELKMWNLILIGSITMLPVFLIGAYKSKLALRFR